MSPATLRTVVPSRGGVPWFRARRWGARWCSAGRLVSFSGSDRVPPSAPAGPRPGEPAPERGGWRLVRQGELRRHGQSARSEEHTSELQSREKLVCRLLLEKKK